ncbi:hypothetical protein [Lysobacter gummosus]|uniref:hypothetical protein n=1 Tax=Lysobacter gummosus TaxID=262324 RepID=UPI003643F3B5
MSRENSRENSRSAAGSTIGTSWSYRCRICGDLCPPDALSVESVMPRCLRP